MIINHNIPALKASNTQSRTNASLSKTYEKLASGQKLNRAADDSAGVAISAKMMAQIRGLNQASNNASDAISLSKTAQGGLNQITGILHRMKELCVEAANDTLVFGDRVKIQDEIHELYNATTQIANETHFNTIPLLGVTDNASMSLLLNNTLFDASGRPKLVTYDSQNLNYGAGGTTASGICIRNPVTGVDTVYNLYGPAVPTTISNNVATTTWNNFQGLGIDVVQTISLVGPDNTMYKIEYSIVNNSGNDLEIGFIFDVDTQIGNDDRAPFTMNGVNVETNERRFISPFEDLDNADMPSSFTVFNGSNHDLAAIGTIMGAGVLRPPDSFVIRNYSGSSAPGAWNYTVNTTRAIDDSAYSLRWNPVEVGANGGVLEVNTFYGIANTYPVPAPLTTNEGLIIHIGSDTGVNFPIVRRSVTGDDLNLFRVCVYDNAAANEGLDIVDEALRIVSGEQTKYGAYQNKLEFIKNNLDISSENLEKARSLIVDGDMAGLASELAKYKVMEQAVTNSMATSSKISEMVLTLLK